jgi:hypothetical protein
LVTEYDGVTREGTNPHIWFYVEVKDDDKVNNWGFSDGAPGVAQWRGVLKESLTIGGQAPADGNK